MICSAPFHLWRLQSHLWDSHVIMMDEIFGKFLWSELLKCKRILYRCATNEGGLKVPFFILGFMLRGQEEENGSVLSFWRPWHLTYIWNRRKNLISTIKCQFAFFLLMPRKVPGCLRRWCRTRCSVAGLCEWMSTPAKKECVRNSLKSNMDGSDVVT